MNVWYIERERSRTRSNGDSRKQSGTAGLGVSKGPLLFTMQQPLTATLQYDSCSRYLICHHKLLTPKFIGAIAAHMLYIHPIRTCQEQLLRKHCRALCYTFTNQSIMDVD